MTNNGKNELPTVTCPRCRTKQLRIGQRTCTAANGCGYQFSLEQSGVKQMKVIAPGRKELVLCHVRA